MRDPEIVLDNLAKHSGEKEYKYERLYRNLFNPTFYFQAYQNIYPSQGNMTAGTDGQTIDAMSLERINKIILSLKDESYKPNPAKRIYIPKKNGKSRPLGIPSVDDKLVQEVVKMQLNAIYENHFESVSHGFRPNKSCHTALKQIGVRFTGCKWFVEGDIKGFFDNIDHDILINIMHKRIKDERFLRLIRKFLKAGYLEENQLHKTYSGTPQGGIISPILANIYLDEFDKYMSKYKSKFDRGEKKQLSKEYTQIRSKRQRLTEQLKNCINHEKRKTLIEQLKEVEKAQINTNRCNEMYEGYKRLQYIRYADDFIVGVIGSKQDAENIKRDMTEFISTELKLELSREKTLITKATDSARFLGFNIRITPNTNQAIRTKRGTLQRVYNGIVRLEVPTEIVKRKLLELGVMHIAVNNGTEIWQAHARRGIVARTDISILEQFNGEVRGLCNYYSIANNYSTLHRFRGIMRYSFEKTLACKHRTSRKEIIQKYRIGKDIGVKFQDRKGKEKTRVFWNDPLTKTKFPKGNEVDIIHKPKGILKKPTLAIRMQANICEWCGKSVNEVIVHQVRKLKELNSAEPWSAHMQAINRKTLVVCKECHELMHE